MHAMSSDGRFLSPPFALIITSHHITSFSFHSVAHLNERRLNVCSHSVEPTTTRYQVPVPVPVCTLCT